MDRRDTVTTAIKLLIDEVNRLQEIERLYNNLLVNSKQLSENNITLQEKLDLCKFKLGQ